MRRITPDMPRDVAQRILYEEHGDLRARWLLIDKAEAAYNAHIAESASLIHAYVYLTDREAYQRAPWPKGMIQLELPQPRECRHGLQQRKKRGA